MTGQSHWGLTPRQSIERECVLRGRKSVVAGCRRLVVGLDADPGLLMALGGPGAAKFLDRGPHEDTYWLRVWGTRGLLWTWDDSAMEELRVALRDQAWRVREMAVKVVARHLLDEALADVAALRSDPVARVRTAATRTVARLTEAGV